MAIQLQILAIFTVLVALRCAYCRPIHHKEQDEDFAVELTKDTFNQTLRTAPASYALVEFYAHWCPVCRAYKPQYSRVAKLFNGRNAVYPGEIIVAKVDCAEEINTPVCRRFQIDHYPSLFWGPPDKFAWESFDLKTSGIEALEKTPRTAESLLEWIGKRVDKSYSLSAQQNRTVTSISKQIEVAKPVLSLYDIEESTALAYKIITQNELLNSKTRTPFLRFLQLLAAHHPSKRCRQGSADILVHFEDIWLAGKPNYDLLKRLQICRERTVTEEWRTCRGSINGTRGYSCGLWLLFHALSVHVEDAESKTEVQTIRDFVGSFFTCEECRDHFMKMSSGAADVINSQRDLVLWFWRSHNEVNKRLAEEEARDGTGDPKFPKQQWPPAELCTACRGDDDKWDENTVYLFLTEYYGRGLIEENLKEAIKAEKLAEIQAEDSSNIHVAVPVGAAFGIAMASCGFGLVACYWRMQQKRKKLARRRM